MAKVYAACLASYNNGILHGAWLDLDDMTDGADLSDAIKAKVLDTSPIPGAEEWAIHDYDDVCISASFWGEWPNLDKLVACQALVDEHGEAFEAWLSLSMDNVNMDAEGMEDAFQAVYVGQYETGAEYVEELLDETGALEGLPDDLRYYFDHEAAWNGTYRHGMDYVETGYRKMFIFHQR